MSDKVLELVVYQCNYCGKKRRLAIPVTFKKAIEAAGLIDYVDVHRCENEELSAIVCFVDKNCAVRSQARIRPTHAGYDPRRDLTGDIKEDPFKLLGIPSPKKKEFSEVKINSVGFKASSINGLEIKDKIRKKIFYFGKQQKGQALRAVSKLSFVEVTIYLTKPVAEELYAEWERGLKKGKRGTFPYMSVRKWIQQLADSMESIIKLDETMLPYVAEYIDTHIKVEPDEKSLLELELLLNMTISIPWIFEDQRKNSRRSSRKRQNGKNCNSPERLSKVYS